MRSRRALSRATEANSGVERLRPSTPAQRHGAPRPRFRPRGRCGRRVVSWPVTPCSAEAGVKAGSVSCRVMHQPARAPRGASRSETQRHGNARAVAGDQRRDGDAPRGAPRVVDDARAGEPAIHGRADACPDASRYQQTGGVEDSQLLTIRTDIRAAPVPNPTSAPFLSESGCRCVIPVISVSCKS